MAKSYDPYDDDSGLYWPAQSQTAPGFLPTMGLPTYDRETGQWTQTHGGPAPTTQTPTVTPPPPTTTTGWNDRNNKPADVPPSGYDYAWDEGSGRWFLQQTTGGNVTTNGPYGGGDDTFDMSGFGDAPSYNAPDYYAPTYYGAEYIDPGQFDPGPAFSFRDFLPPDPSKIADDPSYQFRLKQGLGALNADRAGRGTFLTGERGKALQDYGQQSASQEMSNVWNRSLSEYDTNRNNAFGSWASQYGQRKDAYGFKADETNRHNLFNQTDASNRTNFSQNDASGRNAMNLSNAQNLYQSLFNGWKTSGDWQNSWLTALAGAGD